MQRPPLERVSRVWNCKSVLFCKLLYVIKEKNFWIGNIVKNQNLIFTGMLKVTHNWMYHRLVEFRTVVRGGEEEVTRLLLWQIFNYILAKNHFQSIPRDPSILRSSMQILAPNLQSVNCTCFITRLITEVELNSVYKKGWTIRVTY